MYVYVLLKPPRAISGLAGRDAGPLSVTMYWCSLRWSRMPLSRAGSSRRVVVVEHWEGVCVCVWEREREREREIMDCCIYGLGETGRIATLLFVVRPCSTTRKVILPRQNQMEPSISRMSRRSNFCMPFRFTFSIISFPCVYMYPCSAIIEDGGTREHSFGVVTPERTYHLTSETEPDKRWLTIEFQPTLILYMYMHMYTIYMTLYISMHAL